MISLFFDTLRSLWFLLRNIWFSIAITSPYLYEIHQLYLCIQLHFHLKSMHHRKFFSLVMPHLLIDFNEDQWREFVIESPILGQNLRRMVLNDFNLRHGNGIWLKQDLNKQRLNVWILPYPENHRNCITPIYLIQ